MEGILDVAGTESCFDEDELQTVHERSILPGVHQILPKKKYQPVELNFVNNTVLILVS